MIPMKDRRMAMLKAFIILIILFTSTSVCFSMAPEELAKEGKYDEAIKAYRISLSKSQTDKERAKLHKALGEVMALKGDYKGAGKEYLKALSLDRMGFSENERFRMAVHLSWGSYLKEAIKELSDIVKNNPDHLEARIHLARSLSWAGRLKESQKEVEAILRMSPENRNALFIQANILRWRGHINQAISIYRNLLETKEDFDIRLGLTYALLRKGDRKGAQESLSHLKPTYPYQEKELKKLEEEVLRATRPSLGGTYQFYHDSDDNQLHRISVSGGGWIDPVRVDLHFRHTDARDDSRHHRSEEVFFRGYLRAIESLTIGGGAGVTQLAHKETDHYLTGTLFATVDLFRGFLGGSISRNVLVDTAQLIENKIRVSEAGIYGSQNLTDFLSLHGSYFYRDYSDKNYSHDFQFTPRYVVFPGNPRTSLGYRLRYLDFDKHTRGGYFDPRNFISHQALVSIDYEKDPFFIFLEPYIGYQSFKRYGERDRDFILGGAGVFRCRISRHMDAEATVEGGNYALGATSGFNYFQISFGLRIYF